MTRPPSRAASVAHASLVRAGRHPMGNYADAPIHPATVKSLVMSDVLSSAPSIIRKAPLPVTAYNGEHIARLWRREPFDVVDADGRPCKQVQTEDKLIAVEWLVAEKVQPPSSPVTWGMLPPQLPKRP